jgi:hypothetical protein
VEGLTEYNSEVESLDFHTGLWRMALCLWDKFIFATEIDFLHQKILSIYS